MSDQSPTPPYPIHLSQPNIFGRFGIYIIKETSNFFWKVVDTVSYKNPKIARLYARSIEKEYQTEYKSFGVTADNKILHIGCGPYPLTEMTLTQQFGAHVVGIDKNPHVIKMAQDLIKRKHLSKQITIEHGNGVDYPVKDFDMIIISSCAIPKKDILENIFHHAKKDCIIIIRELDVSIPNILTTIHNHKQVELIKESHHHPIPFLLYIPWTAISLRIK
jgi:2-polyprenyl-3-methyl-5-hydroxy-6-metoxy-1,4-benzoquinol methylase